MELDDLTAIDAWLDFMTASRGRLPRTVEAYRAALMRLRVFLQGKPLLEADEGELEMFCGLWLHKSGVVARSRKPYISAVRGFYTWAAGRKLVRANVAAKLVHPWAGQSVPVAMNLANAEKLMWAPDLGTFIGIRDAAILSMLLGCGLRVSGVVGLNDGDFQPVVIEGQARLQVRVVEKGHRTRLMPVPRETEMLLRVYWGHEELKAIDRSTLARSGAQDKVLFVSVRSTKLEPHEHVGEQRRLTRKAVRDLIVRYGRRVGVPQGELHPHAMRHLFGTELEESDVPTLRIQELLGHADAKSTAIYATIAMRKKMAAIDAAGPMSKMKTPVGMLLKRLPG